MQSIKNYRKATFKYCSFNSNVEDEFLNHANFENGAQPPKEMHIYETKPGYIRFIQNRDYDSDNYLTYIPISSRNHLCTQSDIMMDKYGDAGSVRYGLEGAFNVALLKVTPSNKIEKEYIRDFLSQEKIKNILFQSSQASTRPSLNESTFKGIKMPVIDKEQLLLYQAKLSSLLTYELMINKKIKYLEDCKGKLLEKYF